jgi:hypothetical protein
MMTQTMVKPSSWISTGIITAKVRDRYLFKLNDREKAELAGILELDQIFTLLPRLLANSRFKWQSLQQ